MSLRQEQTNRPQLNRNRLKAMQHPLRARVLRLLVERGVQSPAEISRALGADVSDVAYHVRQLVKFDCAELVTTRPVRGTTEHFYRATERHLIEGDEWDELDPMIAEDLVCDFMQKIVDDFNSSRKAGIVGSDQYFHITRTPIILDKEGFLKGMQAFERCRLEIASIEKESAKRLAESGETPVPASSSLVYIKVPGRTLQQ